MMEHFKLLRKILVEDWDPVNVGDNPNLREEYDKYLPRIFSLIANKDASEEAIYDCLEKIENEEIGLSVTDERRWATVRKILALSSG